ncbi:MAG: ArsR/SmtB family transcription factor [Candidatus Saccharicenans sp.]
MKLEEAIKIFRLFSDPKRLKIFLLLLDSELCVCEMMDILKVEQSLLSHQLKVLRDAGLIESRRHGRWIFYGVPPKRQQQLRPLFEAWLKDEIARSRKQGQMVKEKRSGHAISREKRSSENQNSR